MSGPGSLQPIPSSCVQCDAPTVSSMPGPSRATEPALLLAARHQALQHSTRGRSVVHHLYGKQQRTELRRRTQQPSAHAAADRALHTSSLLVSPRRLARFLPQAHLQPHPWAARHSAGEIPGLNCSLPGPCPASPRPRCCPTHLVSQRLLHSVHPLGQLRGRHHALPAQRAQQHGGRPHGGLQPGSVAVGRRAGGGRVGG